MFGTLRGALAGRKIAFDRDSFTAAVEGKIVGHGKTIRIRSINVHYDVTVPADALEATALPRSVRIGKPSSRLRISSRLCSGSCGEIATRLAPNAVTSGRTFCRATSSTLQYGHQRPR